jgi:signal transduction histidine kinase
MGAVSFAGRGQTALTVPLRGRRSELGTGRLRYGGGLIGLVGAYYGSAHLGYALQFSGPVAAIVWLPVGVAIAFLYFGGLRFWPAVVVGDLLVNNYSALPFGTALGQTVGNLLEVVVATALMLRFVPRAPLTTLAGVTRTVCALAAGTALSATIGSLSLLLGNVITVGAFADTWRTWWLGDLSGALLVVPLAIAWYRPPGRLEGRRMLEAVAALGTVVGLSVVAITGVHPSGGADQGVPSRILVLIVFPALIWCAVRLGGRGATLAVALFSTAIIWATTHFAGPFSSHSLSQAVLETQLFILVASITTLCLAAAASERETAAKRLAASRVRLIQAADAERRRLERNLHDGAQQLLTGIAVRLGLAEEQVRSSPEQAELLIETAQSELALAIAELRELAHGNHPAVLTQQGLAAAVRHIAERSGVDVDLRGLPSIRLDPTVEATAYYVLAEAVANAQKYAGASSVRVRVALSGPVLALDVVDDGIGGAAETPGSGLEGLRDRVEALHGSFDVASVFGGGTRVAATIPLSGGQA